MSRTSSIFGDPGRIAPRVDKQWRDDFIIELRLLDVPGERIGDALVTVDSHVAESGEPAREAFGEATAYAREIAVATGAAGSAGPLGPATLVGSVSGLLGMLVTVGAFSAWLEEESVSVTTGGLIGLVLLLALAGTLFIPTTLRLLVGHPWRAAMLPALLIGVFVGIYLLFAEPLFTVPTIPTGVIGLLLLLIGAGALWADSRDDADEIVAPGQAPRSALPGRLLAVTAMPLMTVFLLAQSWVLHLLTH